MLASRLITVSPFLLFSLGVIGCSSGPRAEYAPSDHAVCQPVLVVDDSGYQQGNELLFKSLILINQEMTRKDGEGAARQAATLYRKLLNSGIPDQSARAAIYYNLGLSEWLVGETEAAQQAIVSARGLLPEQPSIVALHQMIENDISTQKSKEQSARQAAGFKEQTLDMQELEALFAEHGQVIAVLRSQQEQQTAVIHRALGKIIPVVLPEEFTTRLTSLEAKIDTFSTGPVALTEVKTLMDNVNYLVAEIPPWAEDDYMYRLNPLRWNSLALLTLAKMPNINMGEKMESATQGHIEMEIQSWLNESELVLNAAPDTAKSTLASALIDGFNQTKIKHKTIKFRQNKATIVALLSKKPDSSNGGHEGMLRAADSANSKLSEYDEDPDFNAEAKQLEVSLGLAVALSQAELRAVEMRNIKNELASIQQQQPDIYAYGIQSLASQVADLRLNLTIKSIACQSLNDFNKELVEIMSKLISGQSNEQRRQQDKALQNYQAWTLSQIHMFEKLVIDVEGAAKNDATWYKLKDGWNDERYKIVASYMEQYLLPVNQAFLDGPLIERYQRAYQKGADLLKGRDDYIRVIETAVKISKKAISDFQEMKP